MKKVYFTPEMISIQLQNEDILTNSLLNRGIVNEECEHGYWGLD